jgi:hypothetical protein
MGTWQAPVNPYPPTPHLLDHQTPPDKAVRLVISKVEEQGGEAIFIAYGRSAGRLMDHVCRTLPAGYLGQNVILDPASETPAAQGRRARREVRLHVRRVGGPDRQPRSEDPHQRALDNLNQPTPPELDLPEAPEAGK